MMLAQEEVRKTGHNLVGTEQNLLGLIAGDTDMHHQGGRPVTQRQVMQSDSRYDGIAIDTAY